MANLDMGPGHIGAKRASWQEYNPRNVLLRILQENPHASEKEIFDLAKTEIFAEPEYLETIYKYWFPRNYRAAMEVLDQSGTATKRKQRAQQRAQTGEQINENFENYVEQILMDQVLSCGKRLRDATFGDCKKEGSWYLDLAKVGKANQIVGKQLTEKQVTEVRKRHYGKKK
jgi:hypothetical protein